MNENRPPEPEWIEGLLRERGNEGEDLVFTSQVMARLPKPWAVRARRLGIQAAGFALGVLGFAMSGAPSGGAPRVPSLPISSEARAEWFSQLAAAAKELDPTHLPVAIGLFVVLAVIVTFADFPGERTV